MDNCHGRPHTFFQGKGEGVKNLITICLKNTKKYYFTQKNRTYYFVRQREVGGGGGGKSPLLSSPADPHDNFYIGRINWSMKSMKVRPFWSQLPGADFKIHFTLNCSSKKSVWKCILIELLHCPHLTSGIWCFWIRSHSNNTWHFFHFTSPPRAAPPPRVWHLFHCVTVLKN